MPPPTDKTAPTPPRDIWCIRLEPTVFEGLGYCFYEVGPMRAPRTGEYYLAGIEMEAHKAPHNYPPSATYHIVRPVYHAVRVERWARGKRIPE